MQHGPAATAINSASIMTPPAYPNRTRAPKTFPLAPRPQSMAPQLGLKSPPRESSRSPIPAAEGATGPRKRSGTKDRGVDRTSGKPEPGQGPAPTE